MKHLISIVEIPTTDFARAVTFYQAILDINIDQVNMDGIQMGIFPGDEEAVNIVLLGGNQLTPSTEGPNIYLNAGDNLQITLDKVERNGGQVVIPKTQISPEMGFFAMFADSEGNKMGLHSKNQRP